MQTVKASREAVVGQIDAFGQAFLVGGGIALLGVLLAAGVRSSGRRPAAEPEPVLSSG